MDRSLEWELPCNDLHIPGKVEISPANYIELGQSIRATLIILSLLCAVGIFTSLIKENNQEPKNKDA
jgi:hypothetical protein